MVRSFQQRNVIDGYNTALQELIADKAKILSTKSDMVARSSVLTKLDISAERHSSSPKTEYTEQNSIMPILNIPDKSETSTKSDFVARTDTISKLGIPNKAERLSSPSSKSDYLRKNSFTPQRSLPERCSSQSNIEYLEKNSSIPKRSLQDKAVQFPTSSNSVYLDKNSNIPQQSQPEQCSSQSSTQYLEKDSSIPKRSLQDKAVQFPTSSDILCLDNNGIISQQCQPETSEAHVSTRSKLSQRSNSSFIQNEIRIVLIGITGSGKSSTGNTIIGRKIFKSASSGSSVTKVCQKGETERVGKDVLVIDTPGMFDTGMTNEEVTKEIVKCISMTSPGPHAFIMVVRIGRFTQEERETVQKFVTMFGNGILNYLLVLFTGKDQLEKESTSLNKYVDTVPAYLKSILQQCGNRFIAFDNGTDNEQQVNELFVLIEQIVQNNGGSHYTNGMYNNVELEIQQLIEIERKQVLAKLEANEDKIQKEVIAAFTPILKKNEEQKKTLEHQLYTMGLQENETRQAEKRAQNLLKSTTSNLYYMSHKLEEVQKTHHMEIEKRVNKNAAEIDVRDKQHYTEMELRENSYKTELETIEKQYIAEMDKEEIKHKIAIGNIQRANEIQRKDEKERIRKLEEKGRRILEEEERRRVLEEKERKRKLQEKERRVLEAKERRILEEKERRRKLEENERRILEEKERRKKMEEKERRRILEENERRILEENERRRYLLEKQIRESVRAKIQNEEKGFFGTVYQAIGSVVGSVVDTIHDVAATAASFVGGVFNFFFG